MEKSKSRTHKGISKENLVALTGGLEISTEKRPKMLGEKSKIDEKEVEKVRQEAVLNSLKYIIDNPDKMKDANTLLGKASLLVTPEETRRLALLKSKEILAYKSQIEAGSRKGFENGKNPAKEAQALFESGLYLRQHSKKQLCYFTNEEIEPIIQDYFKLCADSQLPMSVPGLATYLGISSKQLIALSQGAYENEFSDLLQFAINTIHTYQSGMASEGITPSTTYIFDSKNFFGMKDSAERTVNITKFGDRDKQRQIIEALPDSD